MPSIPLNYVSPDRAPPRALPWRSLIAVGILLFVLMFGVFVPVKRLEIRMDAVTGSTSQKTIWPFGITAGPRVDVSPLETRLKAGGIPWTPSWKFLNETDLTLFGNVTARGCGSAPPIDPLRPCQEDFVAKSTDAELRQFVKIMQTGTDSQQKVAVDAEAEKVLQARERVGRQPVQ